MYKALVVKELRETAWIALVAIAVLAYFVFSWMGYNLLSLSWQPVDFVPFSEGGFEAWYAGTCLIFAIALGLRQSAWESVRGTSVFLLHRPMKPRMIYATKLAVGTLLLLLCTGLALGLYCLWAATPGAHASPFYWSWTSSCWVICVAATIPYAGAFLAGVRPARWFGSRLFPIVAALPLFLLTSIGFPALMRFASIGIIDVMAVTAIFFAAQSRDYP